MTALRHLALAVLAAGLAAGPAAAPAAARRGAPPPSRSAGVMPVESIPRLVLPPIDVDALLDEDAATADKSRPSRFALPIDVLATPRTDGAWEQLEGGARLWRMRVQVPGATDLNFGFGRCALPEGATVHVVAETQDDWYEGPYGAEICAASGELWTAAVPGESAWIELRLPAVPAGSAAPEPELRLQKVNAGYRDFLGVLAGPAAPKSGACNNDVACPVGDPWRAEIDSVAVYSVQGFMSCTGTMVIDVPRTFRNWFLTADHCLGAADVPSVVVYWNFQTTGCGGPRNGALTDNQTGATFRARGSNRTSSDFMLMELLADPDPAWNVYHAGWDATDVPPTGTVSIHHPSTDEKAITFNDDPLTTRNSCIGSGVDTHWQVADYEDGTTEPGSSGGAMWDDTSHRVVGTLSGGIADCAVIDYDCYGRFGKHWALNTAMDRQLKVWLDPGDTGTLTTDGSYAPAPCAGEEMAATGLRVFKGPGTTLILTFPAPPVGCATGSQVRMAITARPATLPGTWPTDPEFVDVTAQDVDGGPSFRHVPPAGNAYYLVAETLPSGPGPSGHYGN